MSAGTYMLDTDTCIFLMRGSMETLAIKAEAVPLQQQVMSAVTYAELCFGVQKSAAAMRKRNQAMLGGFAHHLAVLDWPSEAGQHFGEIRADLKKHGTELSLCDLMIASHARAIGAIVVTDNVKDFGRVKGLQVENWTK